VRVERWALPVALSALACRPPSEASEAPQPAHRTEAESPETDAQAHCGPTAERLGGLAWVPADARLTALVELVDADLDAALRTLSDLVRGAEHGLPADIAFGLAHWDFQVPLLRSTLERAGFEPAEIAALWLDDIGTVWVFGSTCDLDLAIERVRTVWNVEVRRTATGALGTPNGQDAFAFDVVFLPGDRIAMAPADRGAACSRVLTVAPTPSDAPRPGVVVEGLEHAPVRAYVQGRALSAGDGMVAHRLRITGGRVEIDDKVPSPP
jgi:hypothetical protein